MNENDSNLNKQNPLHADIETDQADNDLIAEMKELNELRRYRTPFRVLILGRANAGKTTLLERLCGNDAQDAIVYRDGRMVKGLKIKGEQGRGEHNISDEIKFPALPGFVFHDSRGIEAGGIQEKGLIEEFVKKHSFSVRDKRKILHAIWICLPLDDDRPLLEAERELCKIAVPDVPVIAIFTKTDARLTKALREVSDRMPGSGRAALRKARTQANTEVEEWIEERRKTLKSPERELSDILTAPNMQKPDEECKRFCDNLIRRTEAFLPNAALQALLSVVWANNVSAHTFLAIRRVLQNIGKRKQIFNAVKMRCGLILYIVHNYLPLEHDYEKLDWYWDEHHRYERYDDYRRHRIHRYYDYERYSDERDVIFETVMLNHFKKIDSSSLLYSEETVETLDPLLLTAAAIVAKRRLLLLSGNSVEIAYEVRCETVMGSPVFDQVCRHLSDHIKEHYTEAKWRSVINVGSTCDVKGMARSLSEIVEECVKMYD